MDNQTKIEIMADIQEIMKQDKQDQDFLHELLLELQEAY